MIYLSAQPDDYYFLWQLKLQIFNFNRLGIMPKNIHVLIGYNKEKGLANYFKEFFKNNKQAQFYAYPDNRKQKKYLSSLRPHIIAQHFKEYPALQQENIFYHDSDIIFNRLPGFDTLNQDDVWYASNTGSYTNIDYIERTAGNAVFLKMCRLIGISPELVKANNQHMGGAQYLLKNVPYKFWKKLERDCEKLYPYLVKVNKLETANNNNQQKIQAWCTDMWCLWWQAMSVAKVAIHPSLDFTWADTPIAINETRNIIHYTGKVPIENEQLFRKTNYGKCSAFYDDYATIDKNSTSYKVVQEISAYNLCELKKRISLSNLTIILPFKELNINEAKRAAVVLNYLCINVSCNIIVMGQFENLIAPHLLVDTGQVTFKKYSGTDIEENIAVEVNALKTRYGAIYNPYLLLALKSLKKAIRLVLEKNSAVKLSNKLKIDPLMRTMFAKSFDTKMLHYNKGKFLAAHNENSCLFFKKASVDAKQLTRIYLGVAAYDAAMVMDDIIYQL